MVFSLKHGMIAAVLILAWIPARADVLDDAFDRFRGDEPTIHARYRVAYRLLSFEVKQLALADLALSTGTWSNRVTGEIRPALLMDLRVDSLDGERLPEKCRASLHSRLIGVATLPDLQVLQFGKTSHEWYNPTFGSRTEVHDISLYSMEAGSLQFWKTNCLTGEAVTNIANTTLLEEQSRQILPMIDTLRNVCRGARPMLTPVDGVVFRISVNQQVVPLEMTTRRERPPVEFSGDLGAVAQLTVAPSVGSDVQSRPFRAWIVPMREAAALAGDTGSVAWAAALSPEGVLPLVFDHGLRVGSVRCSLTAIKAVARPATGELQARVP